MLELTTVNALLKTSQKCNSPKKVSNLIGKLYCRGSSNAVPKIKCGFLPLALLFPEGSEHATLLE